MDSTDTINFRGKYKQYDADGKPYLYRIGDVVEHKGTRYVAVKSNSTTTPTPTSDVWKTLASGGKFFIGTQPPTGGVEGDRWYRSDVSVMYTLIKQENNFIWVEL
jgi:hypothetical protein